MNYNISLFGQAYGVGNYDASTYETTSTGTTTGTTASTGTTGVLTDTGFDIAAAATLACVIIFAALLVRFWRKPVPVPQEQDRN